MLPRWGCSVAGGLPLLVGVVLGLAQNVGNAPEPLPRHEFQIARLIYDSGAIPGSTRALGYRFGINYIMFAMTH